MLDGTDAVMLSEETAVGHDPAGAVRMMRRVLARPSRCCLRTRGRTARVEANALAHAAAALADDLGAAAVVVPTRTGVSARQLAAFRPRRPILAYSRVTETTRRLRLVWGVSAVDVQLPTGMDPLKAALETARRDLGKGARVILFDVAAPGSTGVPSVINCITL